MDMVPVSASGADRVACMSDFSRKSAATRLLAGAALSSLALTGCAGGGSPPNINPQTRPALR